MMAQKNTPRRAMLLAAGFGKRLRPLTDVTPKPLLVAGERTLIEHHLQRLAEAGIRDVVINLHHLGEKIRAHLGDGDGLGMNIVYSPESSLLETGGGIKRALPMLGDDPVVIVSSDTYIDLDFSRLPATLPDGCLGCLVMVSNPPHHPTGDFSLRSDGVLGEDGERLTYTGISVLSPELVRYEADEAFMLRQVFDPAIRAGKLRGIHHDGYWCDVGTAERLDGLREYLAE